MGTSVKQCMDCNEWNWANAKICKECGSTNLAPSFCEVLAALNIECTDKNKALVDKEFYRSMFVTRED